MDIESSFLMKEDSGSDMERMDIQYSPGSFENTAQVGVLVSGDCRLVALDLLGNISVNFHEMYCKSPLLKGKDFEQLLINMDLHFTILPEELQCFISLLIIPDESLLTTIHWIPVPTLYQRCSDYLLQTKEFISVNTSSASDIFLKIARGDYTVSFPSKEEMECELKQLFSMEDFVKYKGCGDDDLKNLAALLVDTELCNSVSGQRSEQNLFSVMRETGNMIENENCVSHSENNETVDDCIILPACENDPKKQMLSRSNTVKQSNFSKGFLFENKYKAINTALATELSHLEAMLPKIPCESFDFAARSTEFDDLLASFHNYEAFNIKNDGLCQELPKIKKSKEHNISAQHNEKQDVSPVPPTRNISTPADNEGNAVHGDCSVSVVDMKYVHKKRRAADALTDPKHEEGRKKKAARHTWRLTSLSELSNSSMSVEATSTEDKNMEDDLVASGELKEKKSSEISLSRKNLSGSSQSTNSSRLNKKDKKSSADCFISLTQKQLPEASCDTYQSHKPTSKNRDTFATDQSEYSHMPKEKIAESRETIKEESSKVNVSKQDHKDALKEYSYKKKTPRPTQIISEEPVQNTLVTKELPSKESDKMLQHHTILKRISPNSWKVVTPESKKDDVDFRKLELTDDIHCMKKLLLKYLEVKLVKNSEQNLHFRLRPTSCFLDMLKNNGLSWIHPRCKELVNRIVPLLVAAVQWEDSQAPK